MIGIKSQAIIEYQHHALYKERKEHTCSVSEIPVTSKPSKFADGHHAT
jgi:hypothetical protein